MEKRTHLLPPGFKGWKVSRIHYLKKEKGERDEIEDAKNCEQDKSFDVHRGGKSLLVFAIAVAEMLNNFFSQRLSTVHGPDCSV